VEREVIGPRVRVDGKSPGQDGGMRLGRDEEIGHLPAVVTAPATEDAARWEGWGTALKPASEPVVVARKPLAGTVAQTALAHGTGALNIAACRVGMSDTDREVVDKRSGAAVGEDHVFGAGLGEYAPGRRFTAAPGGRWPSNVVLTHAADCQPTGTRKVRTGAITKPYARENVGGWSGPMPSEASMVHYADADGTETVQAWECADGCPVGELDAQSGNRPSGGSPGGAAVNTGMRGNTFLRERTELAADTGGASRFFPTFRYEAKAPARERPSYVREGSSEAWAKAGIRKRCTVCGKQEVNVGASACSCPEPDFQPDPSP
jgi:hypothetical protein